MRGFLYVAVAVAVALPAAAGAQQVRAGTEFRVNSYTLDYQRVPDAHMKSNGDFIISWAGYGAQDTSNYGTFAQRYNAAGTAVGAEFLINTYTTGFQFRPISASDRNGNFVIVWGSDAQDGDVYGVFGQRFAANGTRRGAEFRVNTYTTGGQGASFFFLNQNSGISMAPNGNFVVVWGSYDADQDGSYASVHGQRYDATGARVGGEFQINTYTTGYQFGPTVAMRDDSSFVVVWSTAAGAAYDYDVVGQRYDANGARIGGEFMVPSSTTGPQQAGVVRMRATGEFTVTWTDNSPTGELFARRFDASGAPIGAQFQVNTYTTGDQYTYSIGMDRRGNFIVNWNEAFDPVAPTDVRGRRFRNDGTPREPEYVVNTYTTAFQFEATVSSDDVGNVVSAWFDDLRDGGGPGIFAQRFGGLRPTAMRVNTTGNLVWEPGETVDVRATWRNVNGLAQTFAGTLAGLTGPAGAVYTLDDPAADYGTVANNTSAECTANCYQVTVDDPATRPVQHWDATAVESITPDTQGQQKEWRLHIGRSFTDVSSTTNPFYRFVETLLHHQITGGCGGTNYCPSNSTSREQMAVFVLVAKEGPGYTPPACVPPNTFADVPETSPFCRFIEELARRGVVTGCGGTPPNYCPTNAVNREQMAVFVLVTLEGLGYTPAACTVPMFADVPANSPFCRFIEELARRAVVTGCGGTPPNYCPTNPVTREQMGVFISVTFGLTLYGP